MIRKSDFELAQVDRSLMLAALRTMGREWLHRPRTMQWSSENPTRNYCYVITEWVHRYFAPEGSTTWRVEIPGDDYTHRFNKWPSGRIVDLAAEQFERGLKIPYDAATQFHLLKTGGPQPSRRAQMLAHLYDGNAETDFVFRKGKNWHAK